MPVSRPRPKETVSFYSLLLGMLPYGLQPLGHKEAKQPMEKYSCRAPNPLIHSPTELSADSQDQLASHVSESSWKRILWPQLMSHGVEMSFTQLAEL